jgi:hypothetical protein
LNPIDSFLAEVVAAFEDAFPGLMRSYYLLGSYAEGSAVPLLSDIDLLIIFKGSNAGTQAEAATQVAQRCAARSPVRLDVMIRGEGELSRLHSVLQRSLKSGSRLLHGEDLRPALPEIPLQSFRWAVWDGALHFALSILRGVSRSDLPLRYPEADGEFFGYDRIRVPEWYPPEFQQGTKELVATVSRLCSALLADQVQMQAAGKTEAFRLYTEHIGDEWTPLVHAIFEECKLRWQYRVPPDPAGRDHLRVLCQRTLEFETHALEQCRRYFAELAQAGSPAEQAEARIRLRRLTASDTD